jgi:hypothetical protein
MAGFGFDLWNRVLFVSIKMVSGFGEMGLPVLHALFLSLA